MLADAGFTRRRPHAAVGRHRPAHHRDARVTVSPTDARRPHPPRRRTTSTCSPWPGPTGVLFERDRSGFAGRGARRSGVAGRPTSATALAAIEVDDEVGLPGMRAGRLRRAAVPARAPGRADRARAWSSGAPTTAPGGSPRRRPPISVDAEPPPIAGARPVRPARPSTVHASRAAARRPTTGATRWSPATERIKRRRPRQGRAGPGGASSTADAPIRGRRGPARRCDSRTPAASSSRSTASSAPARSCWCPGTATSCGPQPMAGTAPRGGDPQADARLAAALLASPMYRHEHQVTIDMVHDTLLPFCSYLDDEAEPSVVALANVQHLATAGRGPAVAAAGVGARAGRRRCTRRPRCAAGLARRHWRSSPRSRASTVAATPEPVGWVDARGQRPVGGQHPLRRDRRRDRPPLRRQRHRRRLGSGDRAGRDPRQVPGHAQRHRAPFSPSRRGLRRCSRGTDRRGRSLRQW